MSCSGDDTPFRDAGSIVVYRRTSATSNTFSRINVGYAGRSFITSSARMGWAFSM